MRQPSFKMIIVATGDFAYQRPDGVIVCPIGGYAHKIGERGIKNPSR
jgi:hypothetical protein